MELLLSSDISLRKFDGNYYTTNQNLIIIKRYLRIFNHLTLIARSQTVLELSSNEYLLLDDKRIKIVDVIMFKGPYKYILNYFRITRIIKQNINNPDAAIFRLPSPLAQIVCHYFFKTKKKFALEIVANPYEISKNTKSIMEKLLFKLIDIFIKKACKKASGISYVSSKKLPIRYYGSSTIFTAVYSSVELSHDYFCKPKCINNTNGFHLIHISNFITKSDLKGVKPAIKITQQLRSYGLQVSLTIVGERKANNLFNDYCEELKINKYVNFVGKKTKEELRELMLNHDLLLVTSKSEGLPRVIIEASALGLPCVSTNVGGISELLTKDVLFEITEYPKMGNKIYEILSNPEYYKKLSQNNFEKSLLYESNILNIKRDSFYSKLLHSVYL